MNGLCGSRLRGTANRSRLDVAAGGRRFKSVAGPILSGVIPEGWRRRGGNQLSGSQPWRYLTNRERGNFAQSLA
jgi:hypothetical protein